MAPHPHPGRLVVAVLVTVAVLGALIAAAVLLLSVGGVLLLGAVTLCIGLLWLATPSTFTMPTADTLIRGTWGLGPLVRAPWLAVRAVWGWADAREAPAPVPDAAPGRHRGMAGTEPPPRRW